MPTFVTVADFERHLRRSITGSDVAAAEQALDEACQVVLDELGPIGLVIADEFLLDGSGVDSLVLPFRPVWQVNFVQVDGVALDRQWWRLAGPEDSILYRLSTWGCWSVWPSGRARVRVNADHGYDLSTTPGSDGAASGSGSGSFGEDRSLPVSVKLIAMELAQVIFNVATGGSTGGVTTSLTVGRYSESWDANAVGQLTEHQKAVLSRYAVEGGHPVYQP